METNEYRLDVVSVRLVRDSHILSKEKISDPESAIKVAGELLKDLDREVVAVINLKTDGTPINLHVASMGGLQFSIVEPRELLKASILSNAARLVMVHNHPSGDVTPSRDDIRITDRIARVCDMVGIPLLDHVIVGGDSRSYFSFSEKGMVRYEEPIRYKTEINELKLGKMTERRSREDGKQEVYRR